MSEQKSEVATTTATATGPRVITVVTTLGEKKKIPFEGNKWSDLERLLTNGGKDVEGKSFSGYSLSNMKAVEGVKRNTLEHPDAVVPEGNFNLFLLPYKSKSGAMSRTDINSKIKGFIAKDGDMAKAHFTVEGKNYTQVASAKLEELIESYSPGTKKKVEEKKGEALASVVESLKSAKENKDDTDLYAQISSLGTDEKFDVIIRLLLELKAGAGVAVKELTEAEKEEIRLQEEEAEKERLRLEEEEKEKERIRLQEEEAEKERKRIEKEEDDALAAEMNDLKGGFRDVR